MFDFETLPEDTLVSFRKEAESLGLELWWSNRKQVYVIGRRELGRMRKTVQIWDDGFYTPGTATRPARHWADNELADAARFLDLL